jgi:23S rRNA pseudouridine1911/1915/1917 synthase
VRRLDLEVGAAQAGERLDRFIASRGAISRGRARRALETGGVFLDGRRCKTASRPVRPGQKVVVNLEEGGRSGAPPAALGASRLLYADAHVAAVDKPAGVAAQPTLTSDRGALPDLVAALVGGAVVAVHRLDRETSGVAVLARSREAAAALAEAFRKGEPEKTYLALCARAPRLPEGRIDAPLGRDPRHPGRRRAQPSGQAAATRYRTLGVGPTGAALVEARPETGRTHQIRAHLAELGAPLLGDPRYGGPRRLGEVAIPRVMLHALRLAIRHPATGERLELAAPPPEDFRAVQEALVPQGAAGGPSPLWRCTPGSSRGSAAPAHGDGIEPGGRP